MSIKALAHFLTASATLTTGPFTSPHPVPAMLIFLELIKLFLAQGLCTVCAPPHSTWKAYPMGIAESFKPLPQSPF